MPEVACYDTAAAIFVGVDLAPSVTHMPPSRGRLKDPIKEAARLAEWLAFAKQIANERGGECLETAYVNTQAPMRWKCGKKHEWTARFGNVHQGTWCPDKECKGEKMGAALRKWTIEDLRAHAQSKGGDCLSPMYKNMWEPMEWICGDEHVWTANFHNMVYEDAWCSRCSGRMPHTLADAKSLAQSRGGDVLSTEYTDNKAPMQWICGDKHVWTATFHSVQDAGSWCPTCCSTKEGLCFKIISAMFPAHRFCKARGFDWLTNENGQRKLELDMWCEGLRLALEYNGEQHYEIVERFHPNGAADLERQQKNDLRKAEGCELNDVCLIVVPYHIHRGHRPERCKNTLALFIHAAVDNLGYPQGTHLTLEELLIALETK